MVANTFLIENRRNIGPETAKWLREFNIHTFDQLEAAGALNANSKLKAYFTHKVLLTAPRGIQTALLDWPWRNLPPETKRSLLKRLEQNAN